MKPKETTLEKLSLDLPAFGFISYPSQKKNNDPRFLRNQINLNLPNMYRNTL